ncbi:MAG: hypothetical protein RIS47_30 [Bacteroidota bacterium]|jgi:hypothetical protein
MGWSSPFDHLGQQKKTRTDLQIKFRKLQIVIYWAADYLERPLVHE